MEGGLHPTRVELASIVARSIIHHFWRMLRVKMMLIRWPVLSPRASPDHAGLSRASYARKAGCLRAVPDDWSNTKEHELHTASLTMRLTWYLVGFKMTLYELGKDICLANSMTRNR